MAEDNWSLWSHVGLPDQTSRIIRPVIQPGLPPPGPGRKPHQRPNLVLGPTQIILGLRLVGGVALWLDRRSCRRAFPIPALDWQLAV